MAEIKLECSCGDDNISCNPIGSGRVEANITADYGLSMILVAEANIKAAKDHKTKTPLYDIIVSEGSGPFYNITLTGDVSVFNNESGDVGAYQFVDIGDIGKIEYNGFEYLYEVTAINDNQLTIFYTGGTNGDVDVSLLCINDDNVGYEGYDGVDCFPQICFTYENDNPFITYSIQTNAEITAIGKINSKLQLDALVSSDISCEGDIDSVVGKEYSISETIVASGKIDSLLGKFIGDFTNFGCVDKLYPTGDAAVSNFITSDTTSTDLYSYIDEGVFFGDYLTDGYLLSDDVGSYIQASSVNAEGNFSYKAYVNAPSVTPKESRLRMRVSAPYENQESTNIKYTLSGIKFKDPNGVLITEYEPLELKGDASRSEINNYTTLSLSPITETYNIYPEWDSRYPDFEQLENYTVEFQVIAQDFGIVFDEGYTLGYQKNPDIAAEDISGVMNSIKVSAIEICSSGDSILKQQFLGLKIYNEQISNKIERCFLPSSFELFDFDTGIYPSVSSIWKTNDDEYYSNLNTSGADRLLDYVRDADERRYATLQHMGPLADSGKLTVQFSHTASDSYKEVSPGAFGLGFDQNQTSGNMWFSPSGAFNTLNKNDIDVIDNFFTPETVTLRVLAKKEVGSRDYSLDVIGYSDDCIINVTSAECGFLQNSSGVFISDPTLDTINFYAQTGVSPAISGFADIDDLGISSEAISDKDQYFETDECADHRFLATYPIVNSTEFKWYEIPLQIYPDNVELGASRNYFISSLFEKLYLDIYPLPSGASIAGIEICVRYSPDGGLHLITEGGECQKSEDGREWNSFYPTSRQSITDKIINVGSGITPLSYVTDIPQGYSDCTTLTKSNYSRRWKGREGTVNGPYDVDQFDFGFENPLLDYPFLSGYYLFKDNSTTINPVVGDLTGTLNTTYSNYHFTNLGWRFNNSGIFEDQMPGFTASGGYTTTDWTSLINGPVNFSGDPLYARISDAFENAVRISGHNSYIDFGDVGFVRESGFATYLRFTPDVNVSGSTYNLFDSGVLLSKWDAGNDLEFLVAYSGGFIVGMAKDTGGNTHQVSDTLPYSGYQYPLSVILTYNDNGSNALKLYTDNEFESNWNVLRDSSSAFDIAEGSSKLVVGNSTGSGVGMNMFVSELGFSSSGNLVEQNPDFTDKQVTAQKFLENNRMYWWETSDTVTDDPYKLWSYVDENTNTQWSLGAFKYCPFNYEFDSLGATPGRRTGRDLIAFDIEHHGSGYSQYATIQMPQEVDSGVAYHTQIENDFLRFHLSDTTSNFDSVFTRISKNLPRGYNFKERALVVETVIEHKSESNNIVWDNGEIGPKLIVSLYAPTKEPNCLDCDSERKNYGLVNRDFHYLAPSSCLFRADSVFDYDNLCDESEQWSLFASEQKLNEFTEKYYSTDVDDMFVQYDLVYPSGPAFDSRIDMHSVHVRAEDAWVKPLSNNNSLNLSSSGANTESETLNFFTFGILGDTSGSMPLVMSDLFVDDSGLMPMYTFGAYLINDSFPLAIDFIGSGNTSLNLISTSGDGTTWQEIFPDDNNLKSVSLNILGHGEASGSMPLTVINIEEQELDVDQIPLSVFSNDEINDTGVKSFITLSILNTDTEEEDEDLVFGIAPIGQDQVISVSNYLKRSAPLVIKADPIFEKTEEGATIIGINSDGKGTDYDGALNRPAMPLVIPYNAAASQNSTSGDLLLSLFSIGPGSSKILWNNENYGTDIDLIDESGGVPTIPANDEIRGVELFGYGSCDGNSPQKAIDAAIITDDTVWREETCNEGGIFRATATYTNLDIGYSGNYYGIRKYTDLVPNSAYSAVLNIVTGSTDPISVPRDWEYWNYGICGTSWYPDNSGCCTEDCDLELVNYSGTKLIADYPYPSGDEQIAPSGRIEEDKYGTAVSVKEDLMAIGSPFHDPRDIEDESLVNNGGSVFLYRRDEDVAGKKAPWFLEDKLTLPSGFIRDYSKQRGTLITYQNEDGSTFSISGQKWFVGQEGRQLGHSLDIAKSGDREVVVAGAPGVEWSRTFPDIEVSGIPVFMVVFTDKFEYRRNEVARIGATSRRYDILYKYFSQPWIFPEGSFNPRIDINLLICQIYPSGTELTDPPIREPWFHHLYVNDLKEPNVNSEELYNYNYSGILSKFRDIFPYNNEIYSGIPPIVGVFGDNTPSTQFGASYQRYVNSFIDYYGDFAFASGVEDLETGLPESGYVNQIYSDSFEWDDASVELLNDTLTTGNLDAVGALKYITSGIGQEYAQQGAGQFQIPPESGGRVYIFENESGKFNFVQELLSPDADIFNQDELEDEPALELLLDNQLPSDRFGHAVGISRNGEVISVGSPYSAEACQIYERDESENDRMYAGLAEWLDFRVLTNERTRYDNLLADSGFDIASRTVYFELSQSNKYLLRSDELYWGINNSIKPYKKIFKYHHNDIPYIGTWSFLPNEFAGTSRLGYSTSVSDDGDIVAFGAPTDSFNEFDDMNVWGEGEQTWASYVNAGAVRVFESRKYYEHNDKVVEFFKFGNLDKTINEDNSELAGEYDKLGEIFASGEFPRTFERTDFADIEIPQDAGLAFIITPQIDAASDEIIDNIKSWLALGDRTLVLVGNDPTWQNNGAYYDSNQLVNKILQKLGARMRIIPARNEYESLPIPPSEQDVENRKYNITQAHLPRASRTDSTITSHDTYIPQTQMFGRGVGDIKIDLSDLGLEDLLIYAPCDNKNPICNLPIRHSGDIRAEWFSDCADQIEYNTNWPFHFDNPNPGQGCKFYPEIVKPEIRRSDEDIRPILTAAEYIERDPLIIPADSGCDYVGDEVELSGQICTEVGNEYTTYEFAVDQIDEIAFSISGFNNTLRGEFFDFTLNDDFFDPEDFDGRDSVAQARGSSKGDTVIRTAEVSPLSPFVVREVFYDQGLATSSDVVIMAGLQSETAWSLGFSSSSDEKNYNNDENIFFYNNLVVRSCSALSPAKIIQLGGWTGRSSFIDAYEGSFLDNFFERYGHEVLTNEVYTGSSSIDISANVLWIANPNALPEDEDIDRIKDWLKLGNKRLVVTYDSKRDRVGIAENILTRLGFNSRPYKVTGLNPGYAVQNTDAIRTSNAAIAPFSPEFVPQIVSNTSPITTGCQFGYSYTGASLNGSSTSIDKLAVIPTGVCPPEGSFCVPFSLDELTFEESEPEYTNTYKYVPISGGNNSQEIITFPDPIYRRYEESSEYWELRGTSDIVFDTLPSSGYRVYVNWVSESDAENIEIYGSFNGAHFGPDPMLGEPPGEENEPVFRKTTTNQVQQAVFDIRADLDSEFISLFLSASKGNIPAEDLNGSSPLTPRILSVSGCLLPIIETVQIATTTTCQNVYYPPVPIYECWETPEIIIEYDPEFRPISTFHGQYCNPNNDECDTSDPNVVIEDGPVVVAEELEHFTNFTQGANRSRIVLMTDSSMIQGKYPYFRKEGGPNNDFIRSLYPPKPSEVIQFADPETFNSDGRNFSFTQKIRSPERNSPAKYFAVSGLNGLVDRFGYAGVAGNLDNYTDQEDQYDPADVFRRFTPVEKEKIDQEIEKFGTTVVPTYGIYPRFSGMYYNGDIEPRYVDAGWNGGFSRYHIEKGYDYIDFALDVIDSGFPGELFGWSVSIDNDQLAIGSPFNGVIGQDVIDWSGIKSLVDAGFPESGYLLSNNGGPGAAFYYQRTGRGTNVVNEFLPWEFKQKIKPDNIYAGLDSATSGYLTSERGPHNLPDNFVEDWADRTDMFGYSVSVDSDFMAVGAPGHDFGTLYEEIFSGVVVPNDLNTAFVRKSFTKDFDIPTHNFYDLANSGLRVDQLDNQSGRMVLNNGAVFTFRNNLINFGDRTKEWQFAEKLIAQGYSDRNEFESSVSGTENDSVGYSVSINRSFRGDSDYVLVAGAPYHDFPTSGNHITKESGNAGSAYTWDAMLREQADAKPLEGGYIDAQVFGNKPSRDLMLRNVVYQPTTGPVISYSVSGLINADINGNIFLEVSGFDPATRGFVAHRPYVEFVLGEIRPGDQLEESFLLYSNGKGYSIDNAWPQIVGSLESGYSVSDSPYLGPNYRPSGMSLYVLGPNSDNVYNNMNLLSFGANVESGTLPLFAEAPSSIATDSLLLVLPSATPVIEDLDLRIRGK